jgi:hypothetical protein
MEMGVPARHGCGRSNFQSDIFPKKLQRYIQEAMFTE